MNRSELKALGPQVEEFVRYFSGELGRAERLRCCEQYLSGLLLEGGRKSVEPMAARVEGANAQSLQQFVNQSPWSHEDVQLSLTRLMLERQRSVRRDSAPGAHEKVVESGCGRIGQESPQEPGAFWHEVGAVAVLCDTTLPKRGRHSVGVHTPRFRSKAAGCQTVVTWHYVDPRGHFPLTCELFLPEEWAEDAARLERAGVPEGRRHFRERWEIALELLGRWGRALESVNASGLNISIEAVVCDEGYGRSREFRRALGVRGYVFVARVGGEDVYRPEEGSAQDDPRPLRAREWAAELQRRGKKWQSVDAAPGARGQSEFLAVRVREGGAEGRGEERGWLIVEREGAAETRYYFSNAAPEASPQQLVRWARERQRVERGCREMEAKLGLGHFEGRSWRGLHHHLTLCFMAYCFLRLKKYGSKRGRPRLSAGAQLMRKFDEAERRAASAHSPPAAGEGQTSGPGGAS